MTALKIALRNILRNARRTGLTTTAVAVGVMALLLFGQFVITTVLGFQTDTVRSTGHLSVFRKGYFDFGAGNPGAYSIGDYQSVMRLIRDDPVLGPMIAVMTPTVTLYGIASNARIDATKTFAGSGFIPSDLARMRRWNEYGLEPTDGDSGLSDSDISRGVVGVGLARVLGLCRDLAVPHCASPPADDTSGARAPTVVTNVADLARSTDGAAPASSGRRLDLLAATADGAPNVVSFLVSRAESQGVKELDDSYLAMHFSLAQQLLYGRGEHKAVAIVLQLRRTQDLSSAKGRLAMLLRTHGLDLEVRDFGELVPFYEQVIALFGAIFSFVATIMAIIVLFSVINTMSMSVMERTNEIGTLRALGFRRRRRSAPVPARRIAARRHRRDSRRGTRLGLCDRGEPRGTALDAARPGEPRAAAPVSGRHHPANLRSLDWTRRNGDARRARPLHPRRADAGRRCIEARMKTLIALAAAVFAVHTAEAQTAREIIARADSVRNPSGPFRFNDRVIDYLGGKARDRVGLTIYSKRNTSDGSFDNLVRYDDPPRDAGKMVLLKSTSMWFYDPSSKSSVRISPQQRLIGLASDGDVVTVSLGRDYTSTLVGTDTLQDADRVPRVSWHLDLQAANRDAVYSRIELWLERGTYRPVKGKYYSDSGRLLKIAYFHKYVAELGAVRPSETVIIDAIDPNSVTTMTLSGYVEQDIPDAWFQRDFLPRLSDASNGGEDRDLAMLPIAADEDTTPPRRAGNTPTAGGRMYVEGAVEATRSRSDAVVPVPGSRAPTWADRTNADLTRRWQLPAQLSLDVSGRLNVVDDGGVAAGYDLREAYLTWEPRDRWYLEAGRINVHNGVALGFNPTDVFRPRTLIDQASQDPSVVRDDRLGTVMMRAEHLWTGAEVSIAYAPKLAAPSAIRSAATGATLALGQTNSADRMLATVGVDLWSLSPQAFLFQEGGRTKFGAGLSRLVSQSVVAYAEYAGGVEPSLVEQASEFGDETGVIPATAPRPLAGDPRTRFRSDLAAGGSWAASAAKLTINAEYHYHQSGFDHSQWRRWFVAGDSSPTAAASLWYIREFANDQQQPMTQQQLFVRADRMDAFVHSLELTALAFVNLVDGSSLMQLAARDVVSDSWTVAAYALANVGGARTEHGSLPQVGGITLTVARYF